MVNDRTSRENKVAVGFKMFFVLPAYTCFFFFAVLVLKSH